MALRGKIARLPYDLREQVHHRLLNGETGGTILPWLNTHPTVLSLLKEDFEGLAVNDNNLSDFRRGAHATWLKQRDRLSRVSDLAARSVQIATAGGTRLTDAAAAIAAGQLLELLELIEDIREKIEDSEGQGGAKPKPPTAEQLKDILPAVRALTASVATLRVTDQNAIRLQQNERKLDQAGQSLLLEQKKFQRLTLELFIKWFADERAKNILGSDATNDAKTEQLGQLLFADDWK